MKEIESIVAIYGPISSSSSQLQLVYLLDEKGIIKIPKIKELFEQSYLNPNDISLVHAIGPFDSVEKLNQFAFAVCEELNAADISLISVDEYNSMLESTQQASDLYRDLFEKGNIIENIERKKKGFLSRFFE